MPDPTFRALVLEQQDRATRSEIRSLSRDQLPEGDVLVRVEYSDLNYKDGLAVTGKGKIIRGPFPFVPGIDFVGTVEESDSAEYSPGDAVVLTGWGVGERHWGGYAQLARVRGEWLVPLPDGLSPRQAMAIGTAGFTAMLCVMALEEYGLAPGGERPIAVTGASGGVGSVAVALLAKLGYPVAAVTGSADAHAYLRELGAREIVDRAELSNPSPKPLESERWGGAVDAVGGATLANLLASMAYGGAVAACGLAGGNELQTTVFPFILRGVALLGVESVTVPFERRRKAWQRLARDLPTGLLDRMTEVIPLGEVAARSEAILQGSTRGRIVVDVNA